MAEHAPYSPVRALLSPVAVGVSLVLLAGILQYLAPEWRWEHYPVHTLLEGAGSFAALTVAGLMLVLRNFGELPPRYICVASALLGMGLLDLAHAATHAGPLFIWLHSTAQFTGGLLFLGIVLPEMWVVQRLRWLPLATTIVTVFFVLLSHGVETRIPTMFEAGSFTPFARVLNITGGIGFLVAAATLAIDPWRDGDENRPLLTSHCVLFGVSGVIFEWSTLWDGPWWLWHLVRLAAYACVLALLFRKFYCIQRDLRAARTGLEQAVEEKTHVLEEELAGRSEREAKYMNLTAQLEARARESENQQLATLNIAEDAREARERAEAAGADLRMANEQLDQFAYVASHDLRAPLRSIMSLATWIAEDAGDVLPEDSERHLKTIKERIVRMRTLLDDLLEYSRVGRQKGELDTVNSREVAQRIVALLGVPEGVQIDIDQNLPTLDTFPVPFELVMRNLISNAVKHMGRDTGLVRVSAVTNGEFVHFAVDDDGPGIPDDCRMRIFEIFQTLKPRDEVEGSGMGLALVRKTVEHEGGRVSVSESEFGGARFEFSWPKNSRPERESHDEGSYDPSSRG